jgi:hypothetical protein
MGEPALQKPKLHKLPTKLGEYPVAKVVLNGAVPPVTVGDAHRGPIQTLVAGDGLHLSELSDGSIVVSGKWVGRIAPSGIARVEYMVP